MNIEDMFKRSMIEYQIITIKQIIRCCTLEVHYVVCAHACTAPALEIRGFIGVRRREVIPIVSSLLVLIFPCTDVDYIAGDVWRYKGNLAIRPNPSSAGRW
ncbi:hypothetical protein DOO74_19970 [Rhodobacteraceae bacterium AsT-22]|nr:hypothetical protein DOO74_19970 [Rhodobacteraceae bacterium AsT-22]